MFEGKLNASGFPEWTAAEFRKAYENEWVKPEDEGMIYIVAGTMKQGSQFARTHGIYPPKWRMVESTENLKGAVGSVIYVGSFYERRDIDEIREVVTSGVAAGNLKVIDIDE